MGCCFSFKRFRQYHSPDALQTPSSVNASTMNWMCGNSATHTKYLRQCYSIHIQQDCSSGDSFAQFKQRVQRQCSNMWLGPAFSAFFNIFLKLYPPINRPTAATLSIMTNTLEFLLPRFHAADFTSQHSLPSLSHNYSEFKAQLLWLKC